MKFVNDKKEEAKVTLNGAVYTIPAGDAWEVDDDNIALCEAAVEAGLKTSDKLPTKDSDSGEKKGATESDKK